MLGRLANAATVIRWQNPIHVRLWTCSKAWSSYSRYQNGLQSLLKKFVGLHTQSSWFSQSIHFLLLLKQIFTNLVASKQFCYLTARSVGQKFRHSIAQVGPLLRVSQDWNQGANRAAFLPGALREESSSELIQVVGQIQFPEVTTPLLAVSHGLGFPSTGCLDYFPCFPCGPLHKVIPLTLSTSLTFPFVYLSDSVQRKLSPFESLSYLLVIRLDPLDNPE